MKKTWIKVYEVCPECDGTGWTKNEPPGYEGSAFPDCSCDNGKVGRLVNFDISNTCLEVINQLKKGGLL